MLSQVASAITPIGHGKDQIVESLLKGISGVKPLREDELLSRYIHSRVYGTVDYPIDYDFKRQSPQNHGAGGLLRLSGGQGSSGAVGLTGRFYHVRKVGSGLWFHSWLSDSTAKYLPHFFWSDGKISLSRQSALLII